MTILFHSINGIGLGHLNRSITIAKSLIGIDPKKKIKIITNSKCNEMLEDSGFDYMQLDNSNHYDLLSEKSLNIFLAEIKNINPEAIVFDTDYPRRLLNHPLLSDKVCILVMRKSKKTEIRKMFEESSINLFDEIIIAHDKEEFLEGIGNDISFIERFKNKITYAGLIRKESTKESEIKTITKYNLNKNKTITLISGSGSEFYHNKEYTKKIEDIFLKHFSNQDVQMIDILGPYSERKEESEDRIIRVRYEKDMPSLLKNSNLIISRAGYNSINEIIASEKPAIIFPGKADEDEQERRALFFSRKHERLNYIESIEEKNILELMKKAIDSKNKYEYKEKSSSDNGNRIAAQIIIDSITKHSIKNSTGYYLIKSKDEIKDIVISNKKEISNLLKLFPENETFDNPNAYSKFLISLLKDIKKKNIRTMLQNIKNGNYNKSMKNALDRALFFLESKKIIQKKPSINLKEITLVLTSECNLKCRMCDFWKQSNTQNISIKNIESILTSKSSVTVEDIGLTGGEPFLRKDINEILDLIKDKKPSVSIDISTNGILTEEIVSFFKKNINNPPRIIISIDGIKNHDSQRGTSGAFEKSMTTIKELQKLSNTIKITIKMTITKDNMNEIKDVYNLSKELGVAFELKPVENNKSYTNTLNDIDAKYNDDDLIIIEKQINDIISDMKKRGKNINFISLIIPYLRNNLSINCNSPERNAIILPNGNVHSCLHKESIGNINNSNFDDIIYSEINKKLILETKNNKCSDCLSYHGSAESIIRK